MMLINARMSSVSVGVSVSMQRDLSGVSKTTKTKDLTNQIVSICFLSRILLV